MVVIILECVLSGSDIGFTVVITASIGCLDWFSFIFCGLLILIRRVGADVVVVVSLFILTISLMGFRLKYL